MKDFERHPGQPKCQMKWNVYKWKDDMKYAWYETVQISA